MKRKEIVFFRDDKTDSVIAEAISAGLVEGRKVIVICSEEEVEQHPGDISSGYIPYSQWNLLDVLDLIVVANNAVRWAAFYRGELIRSGFLK